VAEIDEPAAADLVTMFALSWRVIAAALERVMNPTRIPEFMGIAAGQASLHCLPQMPLKSAF
jgi:hypothetical protein